MERVAQILDRIEGAIYAIAGVLLAATALLILGHATITFVANIGTHDVVASVIQLLEELLLAFMAVELLYTAISRARKRVRIVGPKEVVLAALARRARRDSGLVDAIAAAEHVSLQGE